MMPLDFRVFSVHMGTRYCEFLQKLLVGDSKAGQLDVMSTKGLSKEPVKL